MTGRDDEVLRLVVQAADIDTPALKALAKLAGADRIEASSRSADQAFTLMPAGNWTEVAAYCAQAALDCAIVAPRQRLDRVRLVALDMDSTLITIECVDEIAGMLGIRQEIAAITASAMRGEIDFRQSLTRRVALLAGLDVAALQRVYDERLELSTGAERLLDGMRAVGAQSLLVSGGFTFFTERLKARLGLDHTCANILDIAGGKLTPILGSISMDLTTIDLSHTDALGPGDDVTLLGREGEASQDAQQIARVAGTISYNILCGISARVRRVYV